MVFEVILQDAPYAIILEEDLEVPQDFLGTVHYSKPCWFVIISDAPFIG